MTRAQREALDLLVERGDEVVSARTTAHGFIGTLVARALVEMGYARTEDGGITYFVTEAGKRAK